MNGADRVSNFAELLRDLQTDEQLSTALNSAFDLVGFTAEYANSEMASAKRKAIKDNVWGMLDFSAFEMRIIDSPIMQRLRGIRQLGFTYLTYPSAEHTRFIHSLGMAHVVGNFLAGIDRDRSDDSSADTARKTQFERTEALKPLHKRELLYAGLLHDVGHMPFSHASESVFTNDNNQFTLGGYAIQDQLTRVRYAAGKQISLSEAMSIIVVLSERFETFYRNADSALAKDVLSLPRIASLIAGTQTSENCPNIQEIISAAAVDADKIDYVNRDAKACGISVGVDVSRIFLGGGLVRALRSTYDDTYDGPEQTTLFVVNSSGVDTLDEIVQARSSLYQRVYLHPLTRTAEALLARALQANLQSGTKGDKTLSDALSLWSMNDAELLSRLQNSSNAEVASLGRKIAHRNMPKKACAFAGALAQLQCPLRQQISAVSRELENQIRKDVGNSFLEVLTCERVGEIGPTEFENEIKKEAQTLADTLSRNVSGKKLVPQTALDTVVVTWIAVMGSTRPDAMVFQNGDIVRTPALTNVQGQHDASDVFKAVGYVLCDPEWRQIVFQAARMVIYRASLEYNAQPIEYTLTSELKPVKFRQQTVLDFESSARRSNLKFTDATNLEHAACSAGYYDEAPLLAARMPSANEFVRRVAKKFETFDGEGGWRVSPTTVAAFADQFPPKLREPLLKELAEGTYLSQRDITTLISTALKRLPAAFDKAVLVPLSSSSGGATLATIATSLPSSFKVAASLSEALGLESDSIILIDDNAASGVQASAQFYSFSGTERETWPDELRDEKDLFEGLSSANFQRLRETPTAIVTAVGTDAAEQRISDSAKGLLLNKFEGLFYGEKIGAGVLWSKDISDYLEEVGRDLLAFRLYQKSYSELNNLEKEACDKHCFGYGNHGGITVTNVNVPSSTVTALWQPGIFKKRPWVPLFLRRGRYQDLILA